MSYGSLPGPPAGAPRGLHRQAVAAIAGVCAVVLVAAGFAASRQNSAVGLMARVEGRLPLAGLTQLARNKGLWVNGHDLHPVHMVHAYREAHPEGWTKEKMDAQPAWQQVAAAAKATRQSLAAKRSSFISTEEKRVGTKLAEDMRKLWGAKSQGAAAADLRKVELAKGRYEALIDAMHASPVLSQLPESAPGTIHVRDERTGKVYALYEYHVPGGYEDAELEFDPWLAKDLKGLMPFADPIGRNPIYQGVYPNYDASAPVVQERSGPQMLSLANPRYVDKELDLHPLLNNDMFGLAPFPAPDARDPIYQGAYPDYAAGVTVGEPSFKSPRTQQLSLAKPRYTEQPLELDDMLKNDMFGLAPFAHPEKRNPIYEGFYPEYDPEAPLVHTTVSSKAPTQSLSYSDNYLDDVVQEPDAILSGNMREFTNWKAPDARNEIYQGSGPPNYDPAVGFGEYRAAAPQILRQVAPEGAFVVVDGAGQMRLVSVQAIRRMYAARLAEEGREWAAHAGEVAARRAAVQKGSAKATVRASKAQTPKEIGGPETRTAVMKARTQQLLEKIPEDSSRVWGKVYNPKPVALKETGGSDANPLYGKAKDIFNHWSSLATSVNNVYDPAKDTSVGNNFGGGKSGDWWASSLKSNGEGAKPTDQWWKHDHTGRGY